MTAGGGASEFTGAGGMQREIAMTIDDAGHAPTRDA